MNKLGRPCVLYAICQDAAIKLSWFWSRRFLFFFFLPYMGMAAILFNGAEPLEQIVNTHLIEGPMRNLIKIGLHRRIHVKIACIPVYSPGPRQINPRGGGGGGGGCKILNVTTSTCMGTKIQPCCKMDKDQPTIII